MSDILVRQFSGSLVFVLHEIWIKCIHPSTCAHTHTYTLTVYAQIICPLHCCFSVLLTQSNRRDYHHLHTFFSFRRAYLSFLSSTIYTFIHSSFCIIQQEKKKEKDFICIDDNDDDLYVLHLTATGEVQQWNILVDADHRWDRSRRRIWESEGEKESRKWEELDICLIK